MKLNYNAATEFTSADMRDMADPPLIFKVWRNRPEGWTQAAAKFAEENGSVELALEVIGLSLVSVSDGKNTHAIGTPDQAQQLREAIDEASPDSGDRFILRLANFIVDQQLKREEEFLAALEKNSPASGAGQPTASLNGRAASAIPSKQTN